MPEQEGSHMSQGLFFPVERRVCCSFRQNSAPSPGEPYTGYSYPKCNYLLYSDWVITTGEEEKQIEQL